MATYLTLNLLVMLGLAAVMALFRVRLPRRQLLVTLAAMLLLTLVFDALLIGARIYAYDPALILPLKVINIPPEDFMYAIVAAVFIPYLWCALDRKSRRES